jgi:hypothetical protein
MIVSFEHNYVFIKSRKTSGTSMEIALASSAGPHDVITPLATDDELARFELFPDALPRNFSDSPELEEKYRSAVRSKNSKAMSQMRKSELLDHFKLYNHASAKRAKKFLEDEFWNRSYKFTIERHPYEKAVSMAYFRLGDRQFDAVLDEVVDRGKYRNYDLYADNGSIVADFIIRYEKFAEDVKKVEDKLKDVEIVARYPSAKSGYRPDRKPAAETLNKRQREKVQEVCAEEFELMGYEK